MKSLCWKFKYNFSSMFSTLIALCNFKEVKESKKISTSWPKIISEWKLVRSLFHTVRQEWRVSVNHKCTLNSILFQCYGMFELETGPLRKVTVILTNEHEGTKSPSNKLTFHRGNIMWIICEFFDNRSHSVLMWKWYIFLDSKNIITHELRVTEQPAIQHSLGLRLLGQRSVSGSNNRPVWDHQDLMIKLADSWGGKGFLFFRTKPGMGFPKNLQIGSQPSPIL